MAPERFGQSLKILAVKCRRGEPRKDDGIVAPDHPSWAKSLRKFAERLDGSRGRRRFGVDFPRIAQYRELKVIAIALGVQFWNISHQGPGVAGPEDDGIHVFRPEGNTAYLVAIVLVYDGAIACLESMEHPLGIKGWNVRPSTRADNHS